MNPVAAVGLVAAVAALIAAAALYLARVRMPRPPVGVYVPADIALVTACVVLAPPLYTGLPVAVVCTVFGLVLCAAVQFTLAPLLPRALPWLVALAAAAVPVASLGHPVAVRAGTDVLLAVAVVGVANLWTQSGMRSAHVAALAVLLACYDLVATTLTGVTLRFAGQVLGRPFAPLFQLTGGHAPVAVGLGDLLLLVLFPLTTAKAWGRRPALVAATVGATVTALTAAGFACGVLRSGFPLMVPLGPLIAVQHLWWTRQLGGERTTREWRERVSRGPGRGAGLVAGPDSGAVGSDAGAGPAPEDLTAALAATPPPGTPPGTWLALASGRVAGTGTTPGLAHRAARRAGETRAVVVRQV